MNVEPVICLACGEQNLPDRKACSRCGKKLPSLNVTDLLPIKDFPLPLTPSVLKPVPALLALGAGGGFLIIVYAIFAANILVPFPRATVYAASVILIFSSPYGLPLAGIITMGVCLLLGKHKALRVGLGEDRRVGALVYSAAFSIAFTFLPFICLFAGVPVILAPIIPIVVIAVGLFVYRKLSGPRKVSPG